MAAAVANCSTKLMDARLERAKLLATKKDKLVQISLLMESVS